jgi:hypothetical protein
MKNWKKKGFMFEDNCCCVVLLYVMAALFVALTLPVITIHFDVDTFSPHLPLVTSVLFFF